MDESSSTNDRHWLDDRLRGVRGEDSGFTVVNSPLRPVVERGDPWKVDVRHHELKAFLEPLARSEDGVARVALLTDVEEDPVARVQTAVLMARRLAEQGRKVLLVDGDVRHVGLSRWLPDRDLDAEGLVDVLQYGASVPALRRSGPVEGVDVLAVGSYRPDDASLFEEDAVLRLMSQLRAEADVVIVLAPGWVTDERFHPLLVHADTVIVSIHLDRTLGPRLQELLQYLTGLNVPVAGLMTYAGPDAAERHVDDVFGAKAPAGARTDDVVPSGPVQEPLPTPPGGVEPVSSEPVSSEAVSSEAGQAEPAVEPLLSEPETRPRAIEPREEDDGGTSRVFRVAAVVSLVVILAFVGWWGLSSRTDDAIPDVPGRPPVEVAADRTDARESTPPEAITTDEAASTIADDELPTDDEQAATDPGDETAAADDGGAPQETAPVTAQPETAVDAPVNPADDGSGDDMEAALAQRPGGGGYALHVASFASQARAETDAEKLRQDEGWDPLVRAATVDGQEWYRVLVGRFAERADAMDARGFVGEIVDADWIGIIRVP